ncbi:hypothetical protein Q8F55_000892 [Vanrija albida]|uniref:Tetratrico peptide repeat group 5 domain-containing protein n=1 Tax=Vanrija albida TaxID=181172 RepID=A0ABR3QEL5_9TREE
MSRFARVALRSLPRARPTVTPARLALPSTPASSRVPAMSRSYATPPDTPSAGDTGLAHAQTLLEDGTRALEDGDLSKARALYTESVGARATSGGWFNLGVVEYQLGNLPAAIDAWRSSIALEPSADAYTNLGSAYMMSKPPNAPEAIKALTAAMSISPEDAEIQYNLAAILESTDNLDTALTLYKKAHAGGIERAAANARNVGGKILAKKLKEEGENK